LKFGIVLVFFRLEFNREDHTRFKAASNCESGMLLELGCSPG
jgi:hypothetical protein